jgi:hypothetical protein
MNPEKQVPEITDKGKALALWLAGIVIGLITIAILLK